MLDLHVTIEGDKVVIAGLKRLADEMPSVVRRGISIAAHEIYREAYKNLSGPGAKGRTSGTAVKKDGRWKVKNQKWTKQSIGSGGYPVPVRTGWLRRSLNWLKPGESKTSDFGTFTAGPLEAVVYDSAIYADIIHEGKGSSAKFGPHRFLRDALMRVNVKEILEEKIQKEIDRR